MENFFVYSIPVSPSASSHKEVKNVEKRRQNVVVFGHENRQRKGQEVQDRIVIKHQNSPVKCPSVCSIPRQAGWTLNSIHRPAVIPSRRYWTPPILNFPTKSLTIVFCS